MTAAARPVDLVCDGNRLNAEVVIPDSPKAAAVLLHGIPSVEPPAPEDKGYGGLARQVAERGWAALWADMRAVRGSEGFFSIEGWVRDAAAVVEAARSVPELQSLPLALVASSAGGAVSVEAVRRGLAVDALAILAAPAAWVSFAADPASGVRRIVDQAGMALPEEVLADPSVWAAEFEGVVPEIAAREVHVPMLVVHGTVDETVPVDHAPRIADAAPNAELRIIEGADHQLRLRPDVVDLVFDWLEGKVL